MEPIIVDSARKHDIDDADILHAYRNPIRTSYPENEDEDDCVMFYGPDYAGNPLEIGWVISGDGRVVIIHANQDQTKNMRW